MTNHAEPMINAENAARSVAPDVSIRGMATGMTAVLAVAVIG
jgi:hypothetical protein